MPRLAKFVSPITLCALLSACGGGAGQVFPLSPVDAESRLHNLDDSGFIEARRCAVPITLSAQSLDATTIKWSINAEGTEGAAFSLKVEPAENGQSRVIIALPKDPAGGEIYDGVKPTFDSPQMVESAEMMIDLIYGKKYVSEGAIGYEYPDVLTGFQQGKAVTAFQWNAAAPTFLDASKSPETAGKLGFSALPYFKDQGSKINRFIPSPHGLGVSTYSKNQKEAFAYIAWFTSQEIARDYVTNGGGSSGRVSLLTDKDVLAKNPQYLALNEVLKQQHPFPPLEQYLYTWNIILGAHTSAIWSNQEKAKEGLTKAKEEAIQYLKEQGVKL